MLPNESTPEAKQECDLGDTQGCKGTVQGV